MNRPYRVRSYEFGVKNEDPKIKRDISIHGKSAGGLFRRGG